MPDVDTLDEHFRAAVAAIDAGDVALLQRLIAADPRLVTERLETPGAWLRDKIGGALDGFFARPYLLWFVAEDAVLHDRLPHNIAQVTRTLIDAARAHNAGSLQEQLDYTLHLVSWSGVAAKCGVQLELIDTLVDAGASVDEEINTPLVNGHFAAAQRLLDHGAPLTFEAAVCLERWSDVDRMTPETDARQRQFALVLAALNGKSSAVVKMIASGVDVNVPSDSLYSHGMPLHHAVCSGSLDTVKALVNAGANVHAADTAWNGTPLGWAQHYVESAEPARTARYVEIASYLREQKRRR